MPPSQEIWPHPVSGHLPMCPSPVDWYQSQRLENQPQNHPLLHPGAVIPQVLSIPAPRTCSSPPPLLLPSALCGLNSSVNCLLWPCVFTFQNTGPTLLLLFKNIRLFGIYVAAAGLSYSVWGQTHQERRVSAAGASRKSPTTSSRGSPSCLELIFPGALDLVGKQNKRQKDKSEQVH